MEKNNENFFIIEDLTIEDIKIPENNVQKDNYNYSNKMDSLFKELDFHENQIKGLYDLELKEKKNYKISKQVDINYTKKNDIIIKEYNRFKPLALYRFLININIETNYIIQSPISIELKAVRKKSEFEIKKKMCINGDKIIEEEPQDIDEYSCLPFCQILNNCKERSYLWELFPQEISANQLEQSGGTCYMVSALESLSHVPKLLNYIFDTNFSSEQKKFQLNFRQNDETMEHYIVQNNFPTENIHNLKFMKPLENEAYGIIFEKVWAVIRGGYNNINGGLECNVLNKVLGTNCQDLYNKNMGIFDIDINAYYFYKMNSNYSNNIPKIPYDNLVKQVQEIKEGDICWKQFIMTQKDELKIDPKTVFELIKNSQKNDGAIITTSINMGKEKNSGHAYSVLGTYSKKNPYNNSVQDFVILKNPWRAGNDIKEKIDIIGIENQIRDFPEIIEINNKHYNTGVFYMPKEYYEKWFRNIVICKPNYQKYFPEVYNAFNLYKEIANYYKINSQQCFFDVTQGQNLIKTDVISKQKYESLLKLVQQNKSEFTYAYDKDSLSTIWYDGKYIHSLSDSVFVKDTDNINYNIKKSDEITKDEFYKTDVYKSEITFANKGNKIFSVIKLTKVKRFEDLFQIKDFNKNPYSIRRLNPLNDDLSKMGRFKNEIKEFLREKYNFVKTTNTITINDGWINCFSGINLQSDNYENGHYHVYNLGENNNINLFQLIGKEYKCSCFYIENGRTVKYCNKYFIFKKKVFFNDFTYYIDGVKKTTSKDKCDYYNLEKEKVDLSNNQFFINY